MSIKNQTMLIVAQKKINDVLRNKKIPDLSKADRIVVTTYLTVMKDIYNGKNV